MIVDQTKNFNTYVERVNALEKQIADLEKLLESTQQELAATIKERQDKENQYNNDKAERDRERKVILKLIDIVEKRLENMSKFLRSKTGGF